MPRLVLPIRTTTIPATAIAPILSRVMDCGGATSPLTRRRRSRRNIIAPATTTSAIITIQLATGLSAPASMSLSTLLFSRMTPPFPMLPAALIRNSSAPDRKR